MTYERNPKTGRQNKVWNCRGPGCDKVFRRVGSLRDHLRIHRNEKPFLCTLCGKAWAQKGNRDRHEDVCTFPGGIKAELDGDANVREQLSLVRDLRKNYGENGGKKSRKYEVQEPDVDSDKMIFAGS